MSNDFQVTGSSASALFTLRIHRGEGMALLAMNWRSGKPPKEFVGFVIEFAEPGSTTFFALMNRLGFPGANGVVNPQAFSTRASPIQKFRWVHFPRNADMPGKFTYRVTPAFMSPTNALSYGEPQEAALSLARETYPGKLNVTFTRGFVSSQIFVDRFVTKTHGVRELLPANADAGLDFVPTHPQADEALGWMLGVRLLQLGSPAVTVEMRGFDLHSGEVDGAPALYSMLGRLWATLRWLLGRIREPGGDGSMLDHTLVVTMSDFGRDRGAYGGFNGGEGSDHGVDPSCYYLAHAVMGAGVVPNRILGAAPLDTFDARAPGAAYAPRQMLATLLAALGLDHRAPVWGFDDVTSLVPLWG